MSDQIKTVFITGAGSGIGLAAARRFLRAGWNVAALDVSEQRLEGVLSGREQPMAPLRGRR